MHESKFIGYFPSFYFGEPALLVLVDGEVISWLISHFQQLASGSSQPGFAFVLGDGNPISSYGRCVVTIVPDNQGRGTRLARAGSNDFCWTVSRSSAEHFIALLSELRKSDDPTHQYLDSDDQASPVVIISRGEYPADKVRSWIEETASRT
jgi:hypothetical protein